MIIPITYLLVCKKKTPIMVPRQWLLTLHDRRKIYVPRPQTQVRRISYFYRLKIQSTLHSSFNKRECIVKNLNGLLIFSIKRQHNLYKINLTYLTNQSLRLIIKLKKHNLKGKQVKGSFESKSIVSTFKSLEFLHIDMFGPTRTASMNGKCYGLIVVYDYYRWTWVMFLTHKDKSYQVLSIFCKRVQNEKDINIASIGSDHEGEFENENFQKFCEKHGIFHNFSCPKNTSIKWSCLKEKYISSRYDKNYGGQPNISYLHPFRCECFILNTKENMGKFDTKSDKGQFLGYSNASKAYKAYKSRTLTVEKSIHVKFNDSKFDKKLPQLNNSTTYLNLKDISDKLADEDLLFKAIDSWKCSRQSQDKIYLPRSSSISLPKHKSIIGTKNEFSETNLMKIVRL
ncbi:hypothetical protein CR513_34625, partial [Mucuna pruriens]